MAWASTPTESVEFGSAATANAWTFSPANTIPAGSFIFLFIAGNVASTFLDCSDNSAQAGAANTYVNGTLGSGSTLIGIPIYCLQSTRAILPTDVITAHTNSTASRRNGRMITWTPPGPSVVLDATSGAAAVTASPLVFSGSGILFEPGELAIACGAYKSSAASGFTDPNAGFTPIPPVTGSGGTVTFVEADVSYNPNVPTAASISTTHTYTLAPTSAVGRLLVFRSTPVRSDQPARLLRM